MRDAVQILAQAYIDIRKEGCILFDDMLVVIYCDPELETVIKIRFKSSISYIVGKDSEKTVLAHCQHLHTHLRACIDMWRDNMNDKRW